MTRIKLHVCIAVVISLGFFKGAQAERDRFEEFVPTRAATWEIQCGCVSPAGGVQACLMKVGRDEHNWWQDVHGRAGERIDLRAACYRKRNQSGMGEGLCCEEPTQEDSLRFFIVREIREKPTKQPAR